jgi:hypothetical protein
MISVKDFDSPAAIGDLVGESAVVRQFGYSLTQRSTIVVREWANPDVATTFVDEFNISTLNQTHQQSWQQNAQKFHLENAEIENLVASLIFKTFFVIFSWKLEKIMKREADLWDFYTSRCY